MVSAKPAQGAEPVQCSGAAKIKPPFEMGVDNFAAVIYEIIDANYGLDVAMRDGSISLITVTGSSDQRMQTNSIQESEQSEQDQMQTSVTDNQEEDEQKG